MLFAQDALSRVPGAPILFDVKCTQRLGPAIAAAGGQPMMYKTGHSLIKAKMKEVNAPLGGEMSATSSSRSWYGFDDGTYAGCRLLETVAPPRPEQGAERPAHQLLTPELNEVRGRRAAPRGRGTGEEGALSDAQVCTIDACAWTGRTASASCAPPTPRRCWCSLRGPHAGGDAPHRGRDAGAAAQREAGRRSARRH